MGEFIRNNPALFYSFAIGLVAAIISVVVAAGVPISAELNVAVSGLVTLVASIVIGVVTRGKVVPFKNVLEYRQINEDGTLSESVVAGPANDRLGSGAPIRSVEGNTASEPVYDRH